jgi:hypothetical protein
LKTVNIFIFENSRLLKTELSPKSKAQIAYKWWCAKEVLGTILLNISKQAVAWNKAQKAGGLTRLQVGIVGQQKGNHNQHCFGL